jgi:hypothetical protein
MTMHIDVWRSASLAVLLLCLPVSAQLRVAKLKASDGGPEKQFGGAVALFGQRALVGMRYDAHAGVSSGAAYAFRWTGGDWVQMQKLTASDAQSADIFGSSVALGDDVAFVGAPGDDDVASSSGAVYVFQRGGETWVEQQKLVAGDPGPNDGFGDALSLSGSVLLVGAAGHDGPGFAAGAAYVFGETADGWAQEQMLTASDGDEFDWFGAYLAVSGRLAVVGAPLKWAGGIRQSGAAYVFRWNGVEWVEEQRLTAPEPTMYQQFGRSVAVGDGVIVVGAPGDDVFSIQRGMAYVFRWDGAAWVGEASLESGDGSSHSQFGSSLSVSGDRMLVGAPEAQWSLTGGASPGFAHVFRRNGSDWTQEQLLFANDTVGLGCSLALQGDLALVGAQADDDLGLESGSASVFALNWNDLHHAKPGFLGTPSLIGIGSLATDQLVTVCLDGALANVPGILVVGSGTAYEPFLGGMLVPTPDVVWPLTTSVIGGCDIPLRCPPGLPSGTTFVLQAWVSDVGGHAATNAISVTAP